MQALLSQLPDFSSLGFVSLLGALMSAGYCIIATVLAALATPPKNVTYEPMVGLNGTEKLFSIFNGLSTIMFAVSVVSCMHAGAQYLHTCCCVCLHTVVLLAGIHM